VNHVHPGSDALAGKASWSKPIERAQCCHFVDLYHRRSDLPKIRDFQISTHGKSVDETAHEVIEQAGWQTRHEAVEQHGS
jgi:hypothetical protein